MKVLSALTSILVISASLVGCMEESEEKEDNAVVDDSFGAFSVVAPIDTGINVYHNHFSMNESYPQWLLDQLGVNKVCEISKNGTWEERYEADRGDCWDVIGSGDIVWFKGSRIIGTTPDDNTDIPILDDPSDGHGTAVTGAVIDANPEAVIFFVEGFSNAAVLAAANQPLVDLITTSFGPILSVPVPGIEDATKVAVVEEKKIHTGAADNSPSPAIQDSTAGPPWSIGVSGYAEEDDDQKETMSGSYPDIAADWTQMLPNHDDVDGYHQTSGTSFATPRTAGLLSKVLVTLRSEFEDFSSGADPVGRMGLIVNGSNFTLTNDDIRDALNLSAWYPSFSSWDPLSGTTPISPVAPCTQVGWGVVNESNVLPIIEHLNGSSSMSQRPFDVELCMESNQEIREAYWS